jgi:alpha-mannosidase
MGERTSPETGYEMHVISNTHWDREWRHPLQHTRMMLVDVMDTLLDILDSHPEYRCYHLDSQTVMLEDYLEIRPEMRDKLRHYITEGRIMAGPWYTAPDMNVISGESIVRNLLLGHKMARDFGSVMKVGYTPFSFGHTAQLPQIYAGFDIDSCMFYRGVGRDRAKAEFWWEAPDGTRALTSQFSKRGRYNFYFHVYRPTVDGRPHNVVEIKWDEMNLPVRCADPTHQYEAIYAMDQPPQFLKENIGPGIEALRDEDKDEFTTRYFLLMQGCDTTAPNPDEPRIIAAADAHLPEDRVIHSTLPDYIDKLRAAVKDLPVLTGEMRVPAKLPGSSMVLQDAITARMYLKLANTQTQTALEKWGEPMAVAAWQAGQAYPLPFFEMAWKFLLANQSHDSIAGCGVDEVHEDMMYRFEQARQIGDEITRRSVSHLLRDIDTRRMPESGSYLSVWNSLPYPRRAVTILTVDFQAEHAPASVRVVDEAGNEVPVQIVGHRPMTASVQLRADWPQISTMERYTLHLDAGELPAMGYKTFAVLPADASTAQQAPAIAKDARTLENEHLRVLINDNGTLEVTHKASGKTYGGLHYFEDRGECGTPWERFIPENDRIILSKSFPATVTLEENGPLTATVRVAVTMEVPARSDAKGRSEKTASLPITSWVTLCKGQPQVEIRTQVENVAVRDHQLRVLFPTYLSAQHSYADRPFDVLERPIALPDSTGWAEPTRGNHPQLGFLHINDGTHGVTLLGDGLPEGAVSDDETRTMGLTLLRTMAEVNPKFAFPPPKREGLQCLGTHEFRYAFYPHQGDWRAADAPRAAMQHATPLRVMQSGPRTGNLPPTLSFAELQPSTLVFSGMKRSENGQSIIVRFYNPTGETISGSLSVHWPLRQAHKASLEEVREVSLPIRDGHEVRFDVPPKKIWTIKLVTEHA